VTGAGFRVLATESVVVRLCQGRAAARRVRTDAVPSVALEAGMLGEALAATIIDGFPEGGRRYTNGQLVKARIGGEHEHLALPDGSPVTTASVPLGELIAAQRASAAPFVVSASSEIPNSPAAGLCSRSRRPCSSSARCVPWPDAAWPRSASRTVRPPGALLGPRRGALGG